MDCDKAQEAMMQYMDKKIKPPRAAALARHVLQCADCRERFLLFDAAMDVSADTLAGVAAPDGFTKAVMAKVRKLPAHQARAAAPSVTTAPGIDLTTRVVAGVCVVLLGVALLLTYHHEAIAAAVAANTVLRDMVGAMGLALQFFDRSFNWLVQTSSQVNGMVSDVGYMSLALVLISGAILFVVQRGERLEHE